LAEFWARAASHKLCGFQRPCSAVKLNGLSIRENPNNPYAV